MRSRRQHRHRAFEHERIVNRCAWSQRAANSEGLTVLDQAESVFSKIGEERRRVENGERIHLSSLINLRVYGKLKDSEEIRSSSPA